MRRSTPRVAVIGLGRFGMTLAKTLGQCGSEVIAIDSDPRLIDQVKDFVSAAVRLDSTDEAALRGQEVDHCDVAIVAIGENFEAALLTTVLLKRLNGPKVYCRAQSELHAEIYVQMGVDKVIQPETQAGEALAQQLASPHLVEVVKLAEGFSIIELIAPENWIGKSATGVNLRTKYHVTLVAIKRAKDEVHEGQKISDEVVIVPGPHDVFLRGDILVLVGHNEALNHLPRE